MKYPHLTSPILRALSESLLNPQAVYGGFGPESALAGTADGTGPGPVNLGGPPANLFPGMGPQPSTPQPPNPQASFATGNSPYMPSVTASVIGEPEPRHFATPSNPNLNYLNREPSRSIAQAFGGQMNTIAPDGLGGPSAPMYTVSFPNQQNHLGYEVNIPAGQIQFWRDRGDPDWLIAARLGLTQGLDPNWKGNI